ncbi:MAG: hypothetical protein ACT4PS_05930, partial [Betaproteobacteria bacterium]
RDGVKNEPKKKPPRRVIYATADRIFRAKACYDSGMFASGSPGVILSEHQGEKFFCFRCLAGP